MLDFFLADKDKAATPIWLVRAEELEGWCSAHAGAGAAWVETNGFKGEAGKVLLLPDASGAVSG